MDRAIQIGGNAAIALGDYRYAGGGHDPGHRMQQFGRPNTAVCPYIISAEAD